MNLRIPLIAITVVAALLTTLAWIHNVPTAPGRDDIRFIGAMLEERGWGELIGDTPATFEQEIRVVTALQDAVLARAPEHKGLPMKGTREPKFLYEARYGLCYDRSRAIEKGLAIFGFETRHVAVYSTKETGSAVRSLLTPQIPSHAVTEVNTSRGWLLVDSNRRWISLDFSHRPWSAADLHEAANSQSPLPEWSEENRVAMDGIFASPFAYVHGLYSRHGQFYPPYTPVPDVNWRDLLFAI